MPPPPDIKLPDQSVFDPKDVPDRLIEEEIPFEHHLMHLDDHFRLWAFRKRNRLNVRIDHCPLPRPVIAYSFAPDPRPRQTIWMGRIPDRLDIQQPLGHRPDLCVYRPF